MYLSEQTISTSFSRSSQFNKSPLAKAKLRTLNYIALDFELRQQGCRGREGERDVMTVQKNPHGKGTGTSAPVSNCAVALLLSFPCHLVYSVMRFLKVCAIPLHSNRFIIKQTIQTQSRKYYSSYTSVT